MSLQQYIEAEQKLFPVNIAPEGECTCQRGATCPSPAKHPAVSGWPEKAANDPEIIEGWFEGTHKGYNIGLLLGDGLVCLDIDIKPNSSKDGVKQLDLLQKKIGKLPDTLTATTPSGGRHYLFKITGELGRYICKDPDSDWFGVDVLCEKSFIVAAPSVTPTGAYTWDNDEGFDAAIIAELPETWFKELQEKCWSTEGEHGSRAAAYSYDALLNSLPENTGTGAGLGATDEELEEIVTALSWIPSDSSDWFKILCGIRSVADDRRGLELALEWSAAEDDAGNQADTFKGADDVAYHFSRVNTEQRIESAGEGSIFHIAQQYGYDGTPKYFYADSNGEVITEFKVVTAAKTDGDQVSYDKPEAPPVVAKPENLTPEQKIVRHARSILEVEPMFPEIELEGICKHIADVMQLSASRPLPVAAAIISLVVLGTLTNRQYKSDHPLTDYPNLGVIVGARTGLGKGTLRKTAKKVLHSADLSNCIGHSIKGDAAGRKQLQHRPNMLYFEDEMTRRLAGVLKDDPHGYLAFVQDAFMESGGELEGLSYSNEKDNTDSVINPHLSFIGLDIEDNLKKVMTPELAKSGFLNRMLYCSQPATVEYTDAELEENRAKRIEVISDLADKIKHLNDVAATRCGSLGSMYDGANYADDCVLVHFPDDVRQHLEAQRDYYQRDTNLFRKTLYQIDQGYGDMWERFYLLTKKVTMLLAISAEYDQDSPTATQAQAEQAVAMVVFSLSSWCYAIAQNGESTEYSECQDRIIEAVIKQTTDKNESAVRVSTIRDLVLRKQNCNKALFNDALSGLLSTGVGGFTEEKRGKRGTQWLVTTKRVLH